MYKVIVIACLLLLTGCLQTNTSTPLDPSITPEMAYDFTLESLSGKSITLSDYRGQWVLVNFWATWCKPCVEEMPYLQNLAETRQMVILGVDFHETSDVVTRFIEEHHLTFPILMNPDAVTTTMYKARALPRTFIIAPDGTIALHIIGPIEPAQFDAWLESHNIPLQ